MTAQERECLDRMTEILCAERREEPPQLGDEQKAAYFRALCNIRPPRPATEEFLKAQDEYLTLQTLMRGAADEGKLHFRDGIALYRGDITRLKCGAIVNAGNPTLLGCFQPLHGCIDNIIHSRAGVQVRLDCAKIMRGGEAKRGDVILTKAYNLPCRYILHTVGPQVCGAPASRDEDDLRKCYRECLSRAADAKIESVAFCCISTGIYGYPQDEACRVAVDEVRRSRRGVRVIFDVYTDEDTRLYEAMLGMKAEEI